MVPLLSRRGMLKLMEFFLWSNRETSLILGDNTIKYDGCIDGEGVVLLRNRRRRAMTSWRERQMI